jgi:hypothetical protein
MAGLDNCVKRYKSINRGKAVFTFAMGDHAMYRFMNDNLALESHPVPSERGLICLCSRRFQLSAYS